VKVGLDWVEFGTPFEFMDNSWMDLQKTPKV
jgi:hypothetical protein